MNSLLDTHTVIWFIEGVKLTARTKEIINFGNNFVSVISLWEVAIKMNIGKYNFVGGFSAFNELVKKNKFIVLPVKDEHMERLFTLPIIHRDPFDRLIIATALTESLTIITADENIQKYNVPWIW